MVQVEAYQILRDKKNKEPRKQPTGIRFTPTWYQPGENSDQTPGSRQESINNPAAKSPIKIESNSIKKGGKFLLRVLLRPKKLPRWVQQYTCPANAPDDEYKQKTMRLQEILESFLVNRNRPFTLITTYFAVVPR